jgi:hypothetical protein
MGVTGIVRIGWESQPNLNNASATILTGQQQGSQNTGRPFTRVRTAAYRCVGANDRDVYAAVLQLLCLMCRNHKVVDSVFISLVKEDTAGSGAGGGAGNAPPDGGEPGECLVREDDAAESGAGGGAGNAPPDGGEPGECQQLTQAREGSKPSS